MINLAWKFIRFDRAKSIGVVTAMVISVFLIGQQLSLLAYLMGLMGNLIGNAPVKENQVWIMEAQSKNINAINAIDQRLLQEIASLPVVRSTHPVVIAAARATFLDGKTAAVTLVGSDGPAFVMGPIDQKLMDGTRLDLLAPAAVSAEFFSAKNWDTDVVKGKAIEINGKRATINLVTRNAQAFGASLMYGTLENVCHLGNIPASEVSLIIADLDAASNKEQFIQHIDSLYPHLKAWDAKELQRSSVREILITSNMGMSFGTLVLFAMLSGFFIIGLTLYSSALDRIKDYGTLKAIGARKGYVKRLIITQAFLYGCLGYAIALLLLFGFKLGVAKNGLLIDISIPFAAMLLVVTLFISVGGSLFAVRKIGKLEPASVF
ncbi:ABC transporter permease [Sphingobacterium bambusae]|uniref:ABC transporter permease n=1 Tax=Sphingobacterium bambusae TaxID=662858 RepID=A0ABW6BJC6_9SPHI|nr:ABC transporter permease [Sphingobacterium bambusae]WPL49887.1 ABC transporter permease [Sphingobacterium bambusae]